MLIIRIMLVLLLLVLLRVLLLLVLLLLLLLWELLILLQEIRSYGACPHRARCEALAREKESKDSAGNSLCFTALRTNAGIAPGTCYAACPGNTFALAPPGHLEI